MRDALRAFGDLARRRQQLADRGLISAIAVACSLAPDACWLAAACNSVEELRTWPTAEPICSDSDARDQPADHAHGERAEQPAPQDDRHGHVGAGARLFGALLEQIALFLIGLGRRWRGSDP